MAEEIKIGDWVNSYSKGIYRVEKIIEQYYDESSTMQDGNKIGDKMENKTIVSKRFLNAKLKKAIGYESCNEYFVSHLDSIEGSALKQILTENPKLLIELNEFEIPTLITVYNSDLKIDNDADLLTTFQLVDFIKEGRSFLEIQNEMKRLNILRLKPKHFGNYKLQFFNFDEECVDKRKIWRDAKLAKS